MYEYRDEPTGRWEKTLGFSLLLVVSSLLAVVVVKRQRRNGFFSDFEAVATTAEEDYDQWNAYQELELSEHTPQTFAS